MKKICTLLALIVIAAFSYAGIQKTIETKADAPSVQTVSFEKVKSQANDLKNRTIFWEVDFEEPSAVWSFGSDPGFGEQWQVGDHSAVPADWKTAQGYYFMYLGYFSLTGSLEIGGDWYPSGKWAWINIVSELISGNGPEAQDEGNSWIRFDNINLSQANNPELVFYQLYRPLNDVSVFVDLSTDGGSTWTEIEVNEDVPVNATHQQQVDNLIYTLYIGNHVANQPNVSLRFRWNTGSVGPNGVGYGWQIDDIKIVEASVMYDISIEDSRMSFFEYEDYHNDPTYYHYSSHYGQIPQHQYSSQYALSWFNVAVKNKGLETIIPSINVKVLDPNMTEIYNNTVQGTPLAITQVDTIDIISNEFDLGPAPQIGEYMVIYEAFIQGEEDENPLDNMDTAYFHITEYTMSRDAQVVTARTGPAMWMSGGNDGDLIATNYLLLYEDEITSVDIYIHEDSDPGTGFIVRLYQWMGSWVDLSHSVYFEVEPQHIGQWVNISFLYPAIVQFQQGEDWAQVRTAVEFYYNNPEYDLWIGTDTETNNHSFWGASWYFMEGPNAGQWFSITNWPPSGLGIRINTGTPPLTANFYGVPETVLPGESVQFYDTSLGDPISWEWTFQNGYPSSSNMQNPSVTYINPGECFDVTLTVSDGIEVDTKVKENYICVDWPIDVSTEVKNQVKIYPNPANNVVSIEADNINNVSIIDVTGRIVKAIDKNTDKLIIDISEIPTGNYFVRIMTENDVVVKKLIVK